MDFQKIKMPDFKTANVKEKVSFGKEIVKIFKQNGFLLLENTYLNLNQQKEIFKESANFFSNLDETTKRSIAFNKNTNRGLSLIGAEALDEGSVDVKEVFNIGFESTDVPNLFPNSEKFPNFKPKMLEYMNLCYENVQDLLRALALGCDMPEEFFVKKHDTQAQTFRILHYPVIQGLKEKYAVSPHTDYGTLTMVFQDSKVGLSVQDLTSKEWYLIKTEEGTAIINIGDLLMRWSNDVLKSNPHKADYVATTNSRYATAFFAHPGYKETISCLESFKGNKELYTPINSLDYLKLRLSSTHK